MKPVIFPLGPGQRGDPTGNLQEVLQFFIEQKIIMVSKENWNMASAAFQAEQREQFYGDITEKLVMLFRVQNNLPEGLDVDENTSAAINALIETAAPTKIPPEPTDPARKVAGTVSSAGGRLFPGILVKLWHREIGSRELLGETHTDINGRYEIVYSGVNKDQSERKFTNVQVFAYDKNNVETAHSIVYYNVLPEININILHPDPADKLSEYEKMLAEWEPLLKGLPLTDLKEEDIDLLAGNTTVPRERIVLLQQASISALQYTVSPVRIKTNAKEHPLIPAVIFYSWFRQSLPANPKELFARSAEELIGAVLTAVQSGIIPPQEPDLLAKIKELINRIRAEGLLAPGEDASASLGDVLNTLPEKLSYESQFIVASVLQDKNNSRIPIGEKLRKAGLQEKQARAVENALDFQSFSENFLPLIKILQDDPEVDSLKQLALKVSKADFTQKIINNKAFPKNEDPDDFAGRLYNNLFQKEPTAMLLNMLKDDKNPVVEDAGMRAHIDNFLSRLPESFNIKKTSIYEAFKNKNAFDGIESEFHEKVRAELKDLQRIAAISPAADAVPVLLKARVTSALMISAMPEQQFVNSFSTAMGRNGELIAREIHANAVNAQIRNEKTLMAFREIKRGSGILMIDQSMKNTVKEPPGYDQVLEQNNLSWDYLFGDADFCECGECTSVYSAAAYYVELLQYLRNNNLDPDPGGAVDIKPQNPKDISGTPLQKLFDRRPDLMCLQLTCKNTNAILPYVDLVNEIMESYTATHATKTFNVQEDETSGELLAQAHHTNYKAYEVLHDAVYPFSLPYNQPVDAIRIFLHYLDTGFYELIKTFRPSRDPDNIVEPLRKHKDPQMPLSPAAANLEALYDRYLRNAADAEYLGITQEEYIILTKEAFVSKDYWDQQTISNGNVVIHTEEDYKNKIKVRPIHQYYGYSLESSMLSADETTKEGLTFVKDQLLKRTGLTYLELVELLKTKCVNPNVPEQQPLYIMNRIQFSYRFLQSMTIPGAPPPDKYKLVMLMISLITNPVVEAALNGFMGGDPCQTGNDNSPLKPEDIKSWTLEYFEKIGKIIVLDNGVKCIDGKLSFSNDNRLTDSGFIISKCKIINKATGETIGSVDKTSGLVTIEGQPNGNWSRIVFTGNSGEKGSFIEVAGKTYLITKQVESCDLETVRLIHLDGSPLVAEEYDRIHRFVRLWRKLGWTVNETDYAVIAFSKNTAFEISPDVLHQLAGVKKAHEQTGLELIKLLTFWTTISTAGEKSLYKRLFLTPNLANIDSIFHDTEGRYLSSPTEEIIHHEPVLMAALNLKADDIEAIMKYKTMDKLTIENVSTLYRFRLLSKILGIRAADLVDVLPLFKDPFESAEATVLFLKKWKRMEDAGFTYLQVNYIINNLDNPKKPLAPTQKTVLQLAKVLYDGLNDIQEAHQDLKGDPATADAAEQLKERQALATSDLVKDKAALLYDQETTASIIGILEGTTVYSAECPAGIKDLLRPIPLVAPAAVQDYEYFRSENYPLLRRKIKYDNVKGSLQITGVFTDAEKQGSSLFSEDDIKDLSGLVGKLLAVNRDPVSQYLWNQFTVNSQNIMTRTPANREEQQEALILELNTIITGNASIAPNFTGVTLSVVTKALITENPTAGEDLIRLNRLLLEDAYTKELAKNQHIGFDTIRDHLIPDKALDDAWENINAQQKKSAAEIFTGIFTAAETGVLGSPDNNHPDSDQHTAPVKREKFLQIFLPYLRQELTHRFIVNTLSAQTNLSTDITDLLITDILQTGTPAAPLYTLLENINKQANAGAGWNGYLTPPVAGQYNFVVKDKAAEPVLSIDDGIIHFLERFPQEWWSDGQKLQPNKLYKFNIQGINLDDVHWKIAGSAVAPIQSVSLLPGYAEEAVTKTLTLIQRTALLINGFKLSVDEIRHLWKNKADFDNLDFNKMETAHFFRLESYTRLRNSLPQTNTSLVGFFAWAQGPAAQAIKLLSPEDRAQKISETIEALSKWKKESILHLIQASHFNFLQPELFRNELNLLKLQKALNVADKIHIAIDLLFDWATPGLDFGDSRDIAESVQQAVRAQYNQEDWEKVVKPLNDKLRENQKNMLIAYLLVQPGLIKWGVQDADGLFEFFLIDVQMDACMETSRIKQAISSVQLFIQRCFLGLEGAHNDILPNQVYEHMAIPPGLLDRKRWEWMQRYRVWEANRKVFLYPENWIASNLRDDKSSFFRELESELLQKDINKQNVQDALKTYLYKLDEASNMEVVGVYVETETYIESGQTMSKGKKLHVFARTRNAPYFFYYRYLDIPAGNWYPWEKMQVDIPSYDVEDLKEFKAPSSQYWEFDGYSITTTNYVVNENYKKIIGNGCYLTPFIWNERLLIFFPQFVRRTKSNDIYAGSKSVADSSSDSSNGARPLEYWEIKMAWSEYRNGKWTQKQVSKDAIADIPDIATYFKFWNDFNTFSKAKKKIEDAWQDRSVKYKAAWLKRTRWQNAAQNDKQREWDRYVKAWDQEIDSKDYLDLIMKETDYESVFNTYKTAYNQFLNDKTPVTPDISRYLFEPLLSDTDNLLGIKVVYSKANNTTNELVDKGIFEFDGSTLTAVPRKTYTYTRALIAIDRFHHYNSNIISLQQDDFVSHLFNDGSATTYTLQPLYDGMPISFHHSDALKLLGIINARQLDAFFRFPVDSPDRNTDKNDVFGGYDQDNDLQTPNSYHELKRPYAVYNWELFFHMPMMLADGLSKSQQFEDAMKWYHYVFNPIADGNSNDRFWQFIPFKEMDAKDTLDAIFNKLKPNQPDPEINEWRNNPFNPHLVARSRPVAYMKWVVMKYIDNLVAWGDYLFRQDTIESINQATQLYILAGHILGPRPQVIPKRGKTKSESYLSLLDKWDAMSNAMVELEIALPFSNQIPQAIGSSNGVTGLANVFGFASTSYFCIPNNPKLTGYWDTISDRLFKIRHCENIEGVFRKLPLFEPPIDPAVLVNAAAQGVSISSVVNDINTAMPDYRFYYLLQKALELCSELKSLGSTMLSAMEKKDNEALSLLRSRHENVLQTLVLEVKKQQLEEAQKTLDSLKQNRRSPEHRMKYYLQLIGEDVGKLPGGDTDFSELANAIETPVGESGLKLIAYEKEDMDKAQAAAEWQIGIGVVETLAAVFHALPTLTADGKPMGVGAGVSWGFPNLANATTAVGRGLKIYADNLGYQSTSAAKKGGFLRSLQERVMQANSAGYEIKQIDKQIVTQQIRIGIANLEITNQQKQVDDAQEIEDFLINKYGNEELYSWMKSSLNTLYRQTYDLAFELAKKAEKVYRFERGVMSSNFIQAGYWDAGYNGLLSGERLYAGLKQLEAAYQENRGYDYEITKHVSLKQLSPLAILQLRQTGACEFTIPELLFDMDFPGHYKRRIKSVSISVPCIAGPYASLNGILRLLENKFRNSALAKNASDYAEKTNETDDRFQGFIIPINAIATSSGQNDSGMFELNFKDERYLPFEGAGVISKWRFELPSFRQFDYTTISDLIVHIRYTSVEAGEQLKSSAAGSVTNYLKNIEELAKNEGLFSVINIRHDMPDAWGQLKTSSTTNLMVSDSRLPYFTKLFAGTRIVNATLIARLKDPSQPVYPVSIPDAATLLALNKDSDLGLYSGTIEGLSLNVSFQLSIDQSELAKLEELVILVKFSL